MKRWVTELNNLKRNAGSMISSILGTISSVSSGGKSANIESFKDSELRELRIMLPYGISSSALDGMTAQVMINDGHGTISGIYDTSRPNVKPGEIVIYSKYGAKITLSDDGKISIVSGTDINITSGCHGYIAARGFVDISP